LLLLLLVLVLRLQLQAAELQHLAAAGLLQRDDPSSSQLVLAAATPLPDELLTIVQVRGSAGLLLPHPSTPVTHL